MSAMGKLVLSIQTMLDDNESTDTMISMLCDDYGMSKETALEFICTVKDEYRRYEDSPY